MSVLGPVLLQVFWAGCVVTLRSPLPAAFTANGTHLQHLARDPTTGTLYVGATNFLFQLSPGLQLEAVVSTGPVNDSRDCLPPVIPDECPQAQPTNNPNQLLLVSPEALVVCGSVHQGICELRSLGQIRQLLLRPERPGDTQYVAANDPAVSTVGLVAQGLVGEPLLFVGRGYTSRGVGGGIPPITTRALRPPDPQAAFSYEETAKLAVGRLSEYSHHFVSAFVRGASAYFLFLRRDLKAPSRAFRAYVSRVCLQDQHYYSYVELPLACQGGRYGLIQAAAVATSKEVARGDVLFAAFSSVAPPTVDWPLSASTGASGTSVLCAFPLDEVDQLANYTRDACYTREGRAENGTKVADIAYDVLSDCAQLPVDTPDAFPCGSDHTPSPMVSCVPLEATPILELPGVQLTAVAVTMEDGHTIAFLGDSQGQLHRVYLGPGRSAAPYSKQSIQPGSPVNRDLTFDGTFEHLYVATQTTLVKVPVAPCAQHLDCDSCLAHRDPYCGWCVLLGRCSRRSECSRDQGPEQWLWSFQPELGCLRVVAVSPANISREERREVFLSVPGLPSLWPGESYFCYFGDQQSPALLTSSGVMCPSPDPSEAPVLQRGADHISVNVELRFGAVVIASTSLSFYDCVAVTASSPSAPCRACVSSRWGCNWCVWQQLCTHKASCDAGPMVASQQSPLLPLIPPVEQPLPHPHALREAPDALPEFTVQMGNLRFSLGHVQYDGESPVAFPVAAQVGLGVGTSLLALGVIIIVLIYRRKSKQALRDYKKVQIQLENLESSVRDRCKKEFTDLMTEMTDLTSDLLGSGIPFLDYKVYAERVFFPGYRESPLHRDLGVPDSRRPTVEQGLGQLSNLLNSKLFLTKFIHTLESQRTFSARDRAYVASLLTVALHGKLEYFTDILRTLLSDLVAQYVAKNPKLMLRRTETVVEKLLTNWMSICLYTFVRDSVGEPLYMLFRGIKHQVDKGPVDSVTGKAKYTLNDNRLLQGSLGESSDPLML